MHAFMNTARYKSRWIYALMLFGEKNLIIAQLILLCFEITLLLFFLCHVTE